MRRIANQANQFQRHGQIREVNTWTDLDIFAGGFAQNSQINGDVLCGVALAAT